MANNLTFNPSQLPAFARNRGNKTSTLAKALSGGGGGGGYPNRISIRGGVFRLIHEGKEVASIEERFIDVVIVNAAPRVQRQFFEESFDDNANARPVCWSSDGDKPDAEVSNPPANACAECPNNIKGSGKGETKACRFQQRLSVVHAEDMTGYVLQLVVPGKSLFGKEENGNFPLQAYARWLSAQSIEPNEVVTRIKFDTNESAPKLFFKTQRWLTDGEFEAVSAMGESKEAKDAVLMLGGSAAAAPKALAAPEEKKEEPAPKAKAKGKEKPKAEAEAADEAEEPVVRKAAEAPAIPPRKSVADVVASWDDTDD